jgi:hypothetical protein
MMKQEKNNKVLRLFCVLFSVCFAMAPIGARAVTLYLLPQSQTVYQGDSFLVELRLDTEGEEINAIEANLKFPSDLLEIADFSKGGTIFNFWAQEPAQKDNTISFVGGRPAGFKGEGLILKINFLAKKLGKVTINFEDESKVLLNDGKGTQAKLNFLEGNYEILEKPENLPKISSRTHPDQNKWFKGTTLHLHWDLIEGAEYSFILSRDPLAEPDEMPDRPAPKEGLIWMGDMEYPNLEDGIYYFHLRERRETDAELNAEPTRKWGPKITFRAMIDSTPPEDFKPEIGKDPAIFEGKYFLSFTTADKTSGIDFFEVKEGKRNFKRAESPYLLENQELKSIIKVKAVDKAGNERIAEIIPPATPFPYGLIILILIIAVIILAAIWWIIKSRKRRKTLRETDAKSSLNL